MKRIIGVKSTAVLASAVLLAAGGGVAYAADSCPGMGDTGTTTTATTGTTSTTDTTATTSSVSGNAVRKHGGRRHANRHSGRL